MPEPVLTDHRIVELAAQPTVAVRQRMPMAEVDMAALFDIHLPRVFQLLAGAGHPPAGPPYGRYHLFGPEEADVEIGVPVAVPMSELPPLGNGESDEIARSELPGVTAAVVVHHGPYDALGASYASFHGWISGEGREPAEGAWESYVDDPGEVQDPAAIRTDDLLAAGVSAARRYISRDTGR